MLKPKKQTLKGSSKNAPDNPPIEAKNEMSKATIGGIQKAISISSRLKFNFIIHKKFLNHLYKYSI
jgi:hypothetical protein